jgi:hypothetical protein
MKFIKPGLLFIIILSSMTLTGCKDSLYEKCEKAPATFQKVISEGLNDDLKLKNCYTTASKNYSGSYYVAGEIYGEKMSGEVVGVWILDNYDNPGNVLSVNQSAIAFSGLRASKYDKPSASITNIKVARILKKYVERKYYKK